MLWTITILFFPTLIGSVYSPENLKFCITIKATLSIHDLNEIRISELQALFAVNTTITLKKSNFDTSHLYYLIQRNNKISTSCKV